ncbi:NBS-LRR type resistance protein [Cucumis melo var. makuwa]|uniref:NBS-LRR type resistance protein n=1 Tax=Cucumis melo var. makuwa TaxID=1194695 RepID=A0A5D3BPZ2_CUCMM|nr:NBS-LRR type resistance protein [Cucumis melo var. makuwa]
MFPYGNHKSFLSLVSLPIVLSLLEKVKHEKCEYKIYPVRDSLLVSLVVKIVSFLFGYTYRSSDFVGCTYQSNDPVGCTYQSSDAVGCTYQQSSDVVGCTYQSSDDVGCTYQSTDAVGCTYQSTDVVGCTYQSIDPIGCTYQFSDLVECSCGDLVRHCAYKVKSAGLSGSIKEKTRGTLMAKKGNLFAWFKYEGDAQIENESMQNSELQLTARFRSRQSDMEATTLGD